MRGRSTSSRAEPPITRRALPPLPRSATRASPVIEAVTPGDGAPALENVQRVGVLGAGTMGSGIAQVVAEAGLDVLLHDPVSGAYERGIERILGFLRRRVENRQLDEPGLESTIARVVPAPDLEALAEAQLVIEAIPEELELKREAFRRLDAVAPAEVILATNTSSLPIARIAAATSRPQRVLGMHFFNPVPLMALVE